KGGVLRAAQFNKILERVKGRDVEKLVNEVVLRTQAQAEYAAENYGHFGLNLRRYAHFTSPIRRYADLVVHRALIRALNLGDGGGAAHRLGDPVTVRLIEAAPVAGALRFELLSQGRADGRGRGRTQRAVANRSPGRPQAAHRRAKNRR